MNAKIIYINYDQSQGLQQEIAIFKQDKLNFALATSARENLEKYPTPEVYCHRYLKHYAGVEMEWQVKKIKQNSRILDIGVGLGQTSIYLAGQGHIVSVVEPSPELCEHLAIVANSYRLPLNIYCCNAESIDRLQQQFDLIIFNESLHHCDLPVRALKNCHERLVKGGQLLIVNEPVLPFYRTKNWFYGRLKTHPQEMGHYGGNEHNYRYHEYLIMLKKAGFSNIVTSPNISNTNSQTRLKQAKKRKRQDGSLLYSNHILRLKKIYYQTIEGIIRGETSSRPLLKLLQFLSLIPSTFIATK